MREKKPELASFVLIGLILASILAGAVSGAGVGGVEDGAEEERAHINIINAGLPTTSFLNTQTPLSFIPNNNSLSSEIADVLDDKHVFLFFYADWCHFCHQQMPIIDELEKEYSGKLAFIRINVNERPDYAEEFGVRALPTMFVISDKKEGGYVKQEISSFTEKTRLRDIIALGGEHESDDVGNGTNENPLQAEKNSDAMGDVNVTGASSTTCNSCENCTNKLKSGLYTTVTLTTDITDHTGNCIVLILGESNVMFDCNGHTIDGDDFAIDPPEHGVAMMHGTGNTIRNCVISDFSDGIYLRDATNNVITNNNIISNGDGIELEFSDSNNINSNTINDNSDNGIYIEKSNSNTINSNTVCKNTNLDFNIVSGTGNSGSNNYCDRPDGWNDIGTTGCTNMCSGTATCNSCSNCSSRLDGTFDNVMLTQDITNHAGTCIVFGASNVVFDGDRHKIDGDDSGDDCGIYMSEKSGNTVKNCDIKDFNYGIYLRNSSGNTIDKNTANSNTQDGIRLYNSPGNKIFNNKASGNNKNGISLYNSFNNQIYNTDANSNNDVGIRLDHSDSNQISFNDVHNNNPFKYGWGIYMYSSDFNKIHNNYVIDNYYGIKFDNSHSNKLNSNEVCSAQGPDFNLVGGSSGNSGDDNTCDKPDGWNDAGRTGCTYRCSLCSDGIKNGDEKGVDCGGTYCPPCSQCLTGAKYAPHDTICKHSWPTSEGPEIDINSEDHSCNLIEVCAKNLDYIIEDALLCCEYENYKDKLSGNREKAKEGACSYAHTKAYSNDFKHKTNPVTLKKCLGHYIISSFGASAIYMQGYFRGEFCCHGHDDCPSACREWRVEPPAWEMGHWYACAEKKSARPDFKMGGHRCEYTDAWIFGKYGKDGYWKSDTNYKSNSDSFGEPPAHASINRLSTGTCVDYSIALTTILRKAGYSKKDVYSVDGEGHGYNLVRFPGEAKWHYVDTVSNRGGEVFGGGFLSPNHHCCKGTINSCSVITDQKQCKSAGCKWSGGACSDTPKKNSCGVFKDKSSCNAISGCNWEFCVWYDYCRNLDDGCYNDVYDEDTCHCPKSSMIYGCEGISGSSSSSTSTTPTPMMEVKPAPGCQSLSDINVSEADENCTELRPCVGEYIQEVEEPRPPVNLEVDKYVRSEEIMLGDTLEIAIVITNNENETVEVIVEETFVPGVAYLDLEPMDGWYEGFNFLFYDWFLEIAPKSTETVLFEVLPTSVGYYPFMPTLVSAGGSTYRASSPIVKVVCNPNGVCDRGENYIFCPQDCGTGIQDDFCDMVADGINDPDCEYGIDPDYDHEADTDGDGVMDVYDKCPLTDPGEVVDSDGCSCSQKTCDDENPLTVDKCNLRTASCHHLSDVDQDGVPDEEDNCPRVYNPDQLDSDSDGIGDECEIGYIDSDTTLDRGTYYITGSDLNGAVTINASDVVLDCNGSTLIGTGEGYGVYSEKDNVTIKNCNIRNYRYGIYLNTSSHNMMINNTIEMNYYGIILGSSSNNTIDNNTANSNAYAGIYLEDSADNKIISNIVSSNTDIGIFVHTSSNNEFSENYVCNNTNYDFYVYNSVNSGNNNTCDKPDGWNDTGTTGCTYFCLKCITPTDDLYLNSDTTLCPGVYNIIDSGADGVIIINASNIVLDCNGTTIKGDNSGYGIFNHGFDNVTIKNGRVLNYENGIHLSGSDNSTISNNNVSYSSNQGISSDCSNYCNVYGNKVSFSGDRGIVFGGGGNNAAYNNIVYNNSAYGAIEAIYSDNNEIYNNTAYFNEWGIATNHGSNNRIYDNTIFGNKLGVYLDWPSTNNRVFNNNISSNRKGIWTNHNSTDNIIAGNLIFSNEYAGIRIETDNNTITNNSANNNRIGLYLCADSTGNTVNYNTFCNNSWYDVQDEDSNSGDENTCDFTDNWNDAGTTGCTYPCVKYVTPKDDLYINSDTTLCPGVYNIPDSGAEGVIIINASNVVLDCNGAIINGTMTGSDYGIYSRDYDNVTIKNCNVMNYLHGIELEMSSNSTITDNDLSFNSYGIYLFYSDNSTVTSNNANSNRYKGIGLASSSNNLVTNNNASMNEDGIFLGPLSSNNRIEGDNASSNRQAGIYIYGNSSSNNFSNNKINNNLYGIYLGPCICPTCSHYCPGGNFNNTVKVNEILDNEIGIFSNQSNSVIDSNMVCNNTELDFNSSDWLTSSGDNNTCNKPDDWNDDGTTGCTYQCPKCVTPTDDLYINSDTTLCPGFYNITDSGAEGVIIINASNVVLDCNGATLNGDKSGTGIFNPGFDNVTIKNGNVMNYENGIRLSESDNSIISNNIVSHSSNQGISIDISHHCKVYDNRVSFSGDRGIVFNNGGTNAAYNNTVHNNSAFGAIEAISSDNNEIYNNTAYYNDWGIATNHGSGNQIYENTIYGNELGVYLDWPSTNNSVFNNSISSNNVGIWTNHNSTDNIIAGNLIFSNEYAGIRIDTDNNSISNNTANNNRIGLYLCADSTNNTVNHNTFCNNLWYDVRDEASNSGVENTCDTTYNWNDDGTIGCTYSCPGKPDLVITEIECDRENDRIGYRIKNIGEAAAPESHHTALLVKFDEAWEEMCYDLINFDLSPGDSYQRWFECYTWPECQTIEVKVCPDNYDVIKESDEDNNCLEKKCECAPLKKPDLVIIDISRSDNRITYKIKNQGNAAAGSSTTYLYVDGSYRASDSIGSIPPGGTLSRSFEYTYTCTPPSDTLKVCADATNRVAESNEANNCKTEVLTCEAPPLSIDIYFADAGESPGSVYHYNTTTGIEETVYTRPSRRLYSFSFHPAIPEKLYYVNANEYKIYRTLQTPSGWTPEEVVYTHTTYVRDIAFAFDKDGELRLYFSEATSGGGNGKIYKIEDDKASLYYEVKLADVGGFWAGNFAFDDKGNLYLSSGNVIPASIYKVEEGKVKEIFKDEKECISGLIYADGALYYANWETKIYRLDISTKERTVVYSNTKRTWLSDVDFRPGGIG